MTAKRSRKGGVRRELHQNRILYLMCVPAFVLLLLFCYIPYIGDYMALTDFNVVDGIFGASVLLPAEDRGGDALCPQRHGGKGHL